jgi:hypothetical protein
LICFFTYSIFEIRKWSGLTPELQKALSQQFGLEPMSLETRKLDMYPTRIPRVIIMMREYLINNGGLNTVGIFRLAPDAEENAIVKRLLNNNEFVRCVDINCIANLLKVWFRELPTKLLYGVDVKLFENCRTEVFHSVLYYLFKFSRPFSFVLVVCVGVGCCGRDINHHGAAQFATVFVAALAAGLVCRRCSPSVRSIFLLLFCFCILIYVFPLHLLLFICSFFDDLILLDHSY